MILNMYGGSAKAYAYICVDYPAGSTCTCTKGTTVLTAPGTGGRAVFEVPESGTWTVKAVKGAQSKQQNVSITSRYQVASIALTFTLYLYEPGNEHAEVHGGWRVWDIPQMTKESNAQYVGTMQIVPSTLPDYTQTEHLSTVNGVDMTNYTTLHYTAACNSYYGGTAMIVNSGGTPLLTTAIPYNINPTQRTFNISGITGICRLELTASGDYIQIPVVRLYSAYLT